MVHLNPKCNTLSHWLNEAPFQQQPTQPLPTEADIVIVGGGITGLSTAYWLTKLNPKLSVVVLEARGLSSGATGRNGGIICPGLNDSFESIAHRYGEKEALRLVDFDYINVDMLAKFLEEHSDKQGGPFDPQITWMKHGTICAWTSEIEAYDGRADVARLEQLRPHQDDIAALTAEQVQALTGEQSFKFGALQIKNTAIAWAARIVFCMARAVQDQVHLATFSPVQRVEQVGSRHRVVTSRGTILANKVAYCTNAWTRHLLPKFQPFLVPVRNQVVSVDAHPGPATRRDAADMNYVLSCNRGYQYMSYRPYDDRIIFGGMRDRTVGRMEHEDDDSTLNVTVSCELRHRLDELGLPATPEREWVGVMGNSKIDALPFVGELSTMDGDAKLKGQYIAAGFHGHGMPRTFLCGKALAQLLADQPLDDYFPTPFLLDHPTRSYLSSKAKL
ncbi:FAD dependent oxidoreductase [Hesseltinella vesiculosa]|uniref:FAD dependent oxidoreductase n=1 Tax=Hesseltinella vesiculosa TaxID=101127 RepID=A0A1X2GFL7_9FUNG|nr:FAD dependent oxidoreductase [Hesseltinella vesiculosa]